MESSRMSDRGVRWAVYFLVLLLVGLFHVPAATAAGPEAVLPSGCDPLYRRVSPDAKMVAFVGSHNRAGAGRQHGLFVVQRETGKVRRLLETALKTAPAWSPDSKRLAIGNSPGYGNVYPLVLVDVADGRVEKTGVQGVGAAWSPDGALIAVTTQLHRGGSWSGGVPSDGRIGVWDVQEKKLSLASPAGFNLSDDNTGHRAMSGALRPVWSPDSRWIAYEQITSSRRGKEKSKSHQVWIVAHDGAKLYKVLDHAQPVAWSDDSKSLVVEETETIELAQLEMVDESAHPQPSADLAAAVKLDAEGRARAAEFDTEPVFNRNRAWQNPNLEHLESVQFTHRMTPIRLDERFVWRNDGSAYTEVLHREDASAEKEIGRCLVTLPEPAQYSFGAGSRFPRRQKKTAVEVAEYARDHLMGTRTSFVALDWGRDPGAFTIRDVQHDMEAKTTEITLSPVGRYSLHAGAMFETTSWSYVPSVRVSRSRITIDAQTHRLTSEVDHGSDGSMVCRIDFGDWIDVDETRSVPGRIRLHFPGRKFHVDYRFDWRSEGLWILRQGESRFDEKEPQRQELVDLKINATVPELEAKLAKVKAAIAELEDNNCAATETLSMPMRPFVLGKRFPLTGEPPLDELIFTLHTKGTPFREMGVHPTLWTNLGMSANAAEGVDDEFALVLYDENRVPLSTTTIPLAALELADRPAAKLLADIEEKNSLWLKPSFEDLPEVSYEFKSGDKATECSLEDSRYPDCRRGVTMRLGLDAFLKEPGKYRAPILFDAKLGEEDVAVAVLTGPRFGRAYGNGVKGSWRGYTSSVATQCLLVVEKDTGRPLVSRCGEIELHFSDYVKTSAGQSAPLRISVFSSGKWKYDFRFQVIDEELWLFDRSYGLDGIVVTSVDNLRMDGNEPTKVTTGGEVTPLSELEPFDWASITERHAERDEKNPLVRQIVAQPSPFEHPHYDLLGKTDRGGSGRLAVDLGRSRVFKLARYWTLGRTASKTAPSNQTERHDVEAVPIRIDESVGGQVAVNADGKTQIRSVRLETNGQGELIGELEIVSQNHMQELMAYVSSALLDENGSLVAVADTNSMFRVQSNVYSSRDASLNFGVLEGASEPKYVLLGLKTIVIGAPMGSSWGRFMNSSPLFLPEQMLAAEESEVWLCGLDTINSNLRRQVMRRELFDGLSRSRGAGRKATLAPYLDRFEALFERADDPEGLAMLCRLAGHSEDKRFVEPIGRQLDHSDDAVCDAAAIGLGLLGRPDGIERLRAILDRPFPAEDRSERSAMENLKTDAALALAEIGTDEAIEAVARALPPTVEGIRVTPNPSGGYGVGGTATLANRLVHIVGRSRKPLILPYIEKSLEFDERSSQIYRVVIDAVKQIEDEEAVQGFFLEGVRSGNGVVVRHAPQDAALLPEVGKMILREDLEEWALYRGARYLREARNPKALQWLREAHSKKLHAGHAASCRELAAALASYGDYRGLPNAFQSVVDAVKLDPLPEDASRRNREVRRRKRDLDDDVEDVLMEYFSADGLREFVGPKLDSTDKATLLAALAVAEALATLPQEWKPRITRLADGEDAAVAEAATRLTKRLR